MPISRLLRQNDPLLCDLSCISLILNAFISGKSCFSGVSGNYSGFYAPGFQTKQGCF